MPLPPPLFFSKYSVKIIFRLSLLVFLLWLQLCFMVLEGIVQSRKQENNAFLPSKHAATCFDQSGQAFASEVTPHACLPCYTLLHTQLGLEKIPLSLFLLSTVFKLPFWGVNHHDCLFGFDCDSAILFCFQLHFPLATLNSYAIIRSVDMGYWNIQLITIKLLLEE